MSLIWLQAGIQVSGVGLVQRGFSSMVCLALLGCCMEQSSHTWPVQRRRGGGMELGAPFGHGFLVFCMTFTALHVWEALHVAEITV